jgi:hypothetical protein
MKFDFSTLKRDKMGRMIKKNPEDRRWYNDGYVYCYNPTHLKAIGKGYVGEHILILEKKIGRLLTADECAHHINGIRNDNKPENLMVMTHEEHNKHHNPMTRHLSGKYYGKYFQHRKDKCICGNLKDVRAKHCRGCKYGR